MPHPGCKRGVGASLKEYVKSSIKARENDLRNAALMNGEAAKRRPIPA